MKKDRRKSVRNWKKFLYFLGMLAMFMIGFKVSEFYWFTKVNDAVLKADQAFKQIDAYKKTNEKILNTLNRWKG